MQGTQKNGILIATAVICLVIYSTIPTSRNHEHNESQKFRAFVPPKNLYSNELSESEPLDLDFNISVCYQNVNFLESSPPWQGVQSKKLSMFLYGAYWDNRNSKDVTDYSIHILGKIKKGFDKNVLANLRCYIWYLESGQVFFETKVPIVKKFISAPATWPAYLISCPVAASKFSKDKPPFAVSLADKMYGENNRMNVQCTDMPTFLPVIYNPLEGAEEKLDFAICHKALYFDEIDPSKLFIEWLEIHRILGVKKVFIYEYFPKPDSNISNTLNYYENQGFLELKEHRIPEINSHAPQDVRKYLLSHQMDKWVNELIPYHHCFFRNMYKFKYIALIDLDEVLMPIIETTWGSLVQNLEKEAYSKSKETVSGFRFENNIFPDDEPKFRSADAPGDSHMLQQIFRIQSKSYKPAQKLIYATSVSLGMHNHYSLFCLGFKKCRVIQLDPTRGRSHHYCLNGAKSCANKDHVVMNVDLTAWKFKDQFVAAIEKVHEDLGFHSSQTADDSAQNVTVHSSSTEILPTTLEP